MSSQTNDYGTQREDTRDPGWTPPTRKSTTRTRITLLAAALALVVQGATAATHIPRRHLPRTPITRPHIPRRHLPQAPPPTATVATVAPVPVLCSVLPFLSRCAAKP